MRIAIPFLVTAFLFSTMGGAASARSSVQEVKAEKGRFSSPLWFNRRLYLASESSSALLSYDMKQVNIYWQEQSCHPSALAATRDNHILIACSGEQNLQVMNPLGQIVEWVKTPALSDVKAMVRDNRGGIYIAQKSGTLSYLTATRRSFKVVKSQLTGLSAMTLSRDNKYLYTAQGQNILRHTLNKGAITKSEPFVLKGKKEQLASGALAIHSLAFNKRGHLYIGESGTGQIIVAANDGRVLSQIKLPQSQVTGLSFGSSDREVFITSHQAEHTALYKLKL